MKIAMHVFSRIYLGILIGPTACVLLSGCNSGNRAVEQPITVEAATVKAVETTAMKPISPPTRKETEERVARIFHGDVSIVGGRQAMVLIGDFNGDSSMDLARRSQTESGEAEGGQFSTSELDGAGSASLRRGSKGQVGGGCASYRKAC
jgi:hypothetical protein